MFSINDGDNSSQRFGTFAHMKCSIDLIVETEKQLQSQIFILEHHIMEPEDATVIYKPLY